MRALTPEQAEERLNNSSNLVNRFSKVKVTEIRVPSRTPDKPELPEDVKTEIATRARLGERQVPLAREFGISQAAVSHLERGAGKIRLQEDQVEERISQAQDIAMERLLASMGFMTDDKLSKLGAEKLSGIAANMSKVVSNTIMRNQEANQVHLHLYSPELRSDKGFEVIEVRPS